MEGMENYFIYIRGEGGGGVIKDGRDLSPVLVGNLMGHQTLICSFLRIGDSDRYISDQGRL